MVAIRFMCGELIFTDEHVYITERNRGRVTYQGEKLVHRVSILLVLLVDLLSLRQLLLLRVGG